MNDMQRWLIIGPSGSGKSTLAQKMGDILSLPVIHLDMYFWNPGWISTQKDQWVSLVKELSKRPAWVMDGNYRSTLDTRLHHAECVVFLDFLRHIYLRRLIKRYMQ